jgi:hypothetical protein
MTIYRKVGARKHNVASVKISFHQNHRLIYMQLWLLCTGSNGDCYSICQHRIDWWLVFNPAIYHRRTLYDVLSYSFFFWFYISELCITRKWIWSSNQFQPIWSLKIEIFTTWITNCRERDRLVRIHCTSIPSTRVKHDRWEKMTINWIHGDIKTGDPVTLDMP